VSWLGIVAIVVYVVLMGIVISRVFTRKNRPSIGPAAAGTFYELLNEDKRRAVQIVIEERAGARDPEDADGNLPDLERPKRSG
jgi:hypothetical protein